MADDQAQAEKVTLEALTKDWQRLQRQKSRRNGGVEARVLANLCAYYGEHYIKMRGNTLSMNPVDKNKLHLIFNYLRKLTRKKIGRLASAEGRSRARPDKRSAQAFAKAEIVTKLVQALDEKVNQPMRMWEIYFWLCVGGTAVEYIPYFRDVQMEPMPSYDENTQELLLTDNTTGDVLPKSAVDRLIGQGRMPESFTIKETMRLVGDVGSEIHGPLSVFVDASVRDLESLSGDQMIYLAGIKSHDWIRSTFGNNVAADLVPATDLRIVKTQIRQRGPAMSGMNLNDLIPSITGSQGPDDPDMSIVLTGFAPPSDRYPEGRQVYLVPGQKILDDGPIPYGELPLVDYHWDVTTTSFWSGDFLTDMVPGQKFLNKRLSQLGEQANASIYDLLLLGTGLSSEDVPADFPGFVEDGMNDQGAPMVGRLPGPSLPGWFLESIKFVSEFLFEVGGTDVFQKKNVPGQLRGSLAIPMLQEILDSEDGPLYIHMGERLSRAKQQRINRVQRFYPPVRTLHYTGRNLKDEILIFHKDEVFGAGDNYEITIDRDSLVPELFALREARIRERLNSPLAGLYLDPRTNTIDYSKVAEDMKMGDWDRDGREYRNRKLARERIAKLWKGEPVGELMPFWNHGLIMDELEEAMITSEFESSSPQMRQTFFDQWNRHREFLVQAAQERQSAMEAQMTQSAMAQAAQQTAAKVAAETTMETMDQVRMQEQQNREGGALERMVRQSLAESQPPNGPESVQ